MVAVKTPVPIAAPRTKPPSAPPRPQRASAPPPVPAAKMSMTMKSGPTETGTVARSGVIGAVASATTSGAIPISDRSGAIVESAPIARSAKTTVPPPIPTGRNTGPVATGEPASRLPLRADSSAPSPPSPPRQAPPPSPRPERLPSEDVLETIPQDHPGAMPRLAVPVGEFDNSGTQLEPDKLRIAYEQATIKRDPGNALLGLAEPPETVVRAPSVEVLLDETAQALRDDPTSVDAPATTKFERGDPTLAPDAPTTATPAPTNTPAGTLRSAAALRRKRGMAGDLRYVATVLFGVRRARVELATLDTRQELRGEERRRHLVTLGRAAATLDGFDHPALGPARDQLASVEDERSQHAGAVAAADSELARVRRDRDAKAKQYLEELAAIDGELAQIGKKLEPLEKEQVGVTRRAAELRDALRRLDQKIAQTDASQHAAAGKGLDVATIQAEIATLKADRIAVQRDEPVIAAELDALEPRIAALDARRTELRKHRGELDQAEQDDQRRSEELLAAIGAKRKVVDRATADAETLRDKILFELGERLYVDRPTDLGAQLAPIDEIDVELGTGERRQMELREIISSVDRAKLARGLALAVLLVAVIGVAAAYVVHALV
jgi:prefoldin subunit 5